ncbi:AAA family ATPase [Vibrio vulnificus]|uniref:AAA family ATPase n=1 Tax=Vibrio vulnificus TaxID=672 RepID=UPI003D9C881C
MLKLGRMRIKNFKSFVEPVDFDFSGSDLVLFDGPNGFGKTTIFDAIELCFTGEVSRIRKTDDKTKNDHILKGDNSKLTSVKIEILNGFETLLVIEAIIPANISGEAGKVAKYKSSIQRFEHLDWNHDDEVISKPLDVEKLKILLGNSKLESTFTLFNYIQQEETSHFLKLDENKRHQQVSYLFGTLNETEKANKLDAISSKLKDEIDRYTPLIETKKSELETLSKPSDKDSVTEEALSSGKISKLSDLSNSTIEQLSAYKGNLEGVDWILNNYQSYQDQKFNYQISVMLSQRQNELSNFIKIGSVSDYRKLEKLKRQHHLWKKACTKAEDYSALIEIFDSEPNTLTKEILNEYSRLFSTKCAEFVADIATFDLLKMNCDSSSNLLTKIDECRENLMSHYERHAAYDDAKQSEELPCPLCGDLKPNWQGLLDEYGLQAKYFEEQLSESDKSLADVTKKLIEELVMPLVNKMRRFTTHYEQYLNFDFEGLLKNKFVEEHEFHKMLFVKNWLISNIDGCLDYQDKSLRHVNSNYEEVIQQLISHIESKRKSVVIEEGRDYLSCLKHLRALDLVFDNEDKLVVDSDDLRADIVFLSRLLVQKSSSAYISKENELQKLNAKVDKLSSKRREINEISRVYWRKIKSYEKDVAKHIAIPLFIYSSKILQSRPEGSGIFLITPDTERARGFMQFSATSGDSHDAWNTMSSGQLSGVVISFMLAMNKVYPSKLATLMIDDPVQTMDEVNMASFVQMMKNEFPEVQLLLSTHESKVASYFNYKYREAGLNTLPINMKNKRLELSS